MTPKGRNAFFIENTFMLKFQTTAFARYYR